MSCGRFLLPLALTGLLAASTVHAADTRGFVLTTDFSTGSLSVVDLASRAVSQDVAGVFSDAVARWDHGLLFVVNRLGQDNIQVIDPGAGYATIQQFSVGNGTNPQDIAFTSPTRAYVSRLGSPDLLIVNPTTGAPLGSISLAAFADADGNPEPARMIRVGRYLYVALQRLAGFSATDTSLVAIVDTQADTVVDAAPAVPGRQAIVLARTNPVTTFSLDADAHRLLIGCAGHYGVLDGGIVEIPLDTPSPVTDVVVSEAALGGDIGDIAWNGPDHSYAIVSDASFNTLLISWSAVTHAKLATLFAPGGFVLPDCELNDRGELYVCDNDFGAPGLFVYRAGADTLIAGPLDTGLPPAQVVFDHATATAGVTTEIPRTLALSVPAPNPVRSRASFTLTLAAAGKSDVAVFDPAGRRIRTLVRGELPAGVHRLSWNLADEAGYRVGSGVYLVRAQSAGESMVRRVLVVR